MSGLFFVRIFGMGVERGLTRLADWGAVCGFGRGSRNCKWRPDLESAVEHFFNFGKICSTLEPARGGFGVGGRTFFQILEILFYLGARVSLIWSRW